MIFRSNRKSFSDGAVDEVISTRRLVHISKAFSIFGNRLKAIEMCLNRFDTDTKTAFLDLYTKVDAEATPAPAATTKEVVLTAMDIIEHANQGLTIDQIVDRAAKTLITALDREANDIPF